MRFGLNTRTLALIGIVGVAALTAWAPAGAVAAGDGGEISGGLTDLAVPEGAAYDPSAPAPTSDSQASDTSDDGSLEPDDLPVAGTATELRQQREQLVSQRNVLQQRLLTDEATRRTAEQRRDAALDAIAARIVVRYRAGQYPQVQAIIAARDEADPDARAALVAALTKQDRALFDEYDVADAAVTAAAGTAESVRAHILELGTRIAAVEAVLDDQRAPTKDELARERGDRFTIDAKYVFATGPIPSIGYWGAMSGGSMLTGWMGFAGAAVGGIGCNPPDAALQPTGQVESGEASWYGPGFDGKGTANGETFDTTQMTAAHKTLPFGTIVRVYSSATARCAFVRINDRGPYVDGRIIDLSRAAADAIGMESVAPVQIEVYAKPGG